jgi:hypothetical protein
MIEATAVFSAIDNFSLPLLAGKNGLPHLLVTRRGMLAGLSHEKSKLHYHHFGGPVSGRGFQSHQQCPSVVVKGQADVSV